MCWGSGLVKVELFTRHHNAGFILSQQEGGRGGCRQDGWRDEAVEGEGQQSRGGVL